MINWYIFPLLVYCTKKNLASLRLNSSFAQDVKNVSTSVRPSLAKVTRLGEFSPIGRLLTDSC
jgi:hypothetical protein